MIINTAQSNHQFARSRHSMREGSASYHRRSVSCVASREDYYDHPSFNANSGNSRLYDTIEISEDGFATTAIAINGSGSASPSQSRHAPRKSDGNISIAQLQKSLSRAGITNNVTVDGVSPGSENSDGVAGMAASSFGGKLIKLNPTAPTPRRSLLSDMLNNQGQNNNGFNSRLEQNAHRRRMLKSMRRYSVDASEMDFNVLGLYPSGRASPMKGIPSGVEEGSSSNATGGRGPQEFRDAPTVRYLRNPCHATVKTRLVQGGVRRGAGGDGESPDYFGAEDRVW